MYLSPYFKKFCICVNFFARFVFFWLFSIGFSVINVRDLDCLLLCIITLEISYWRWLQLQTNLYKNFNNCNSIFQFQICYCDAFNYCEQRHDKGPSQVLNKTPTICATAGQRIRTQSPCMFSVGPKAWKDSFQFEVQDNRQKAWWESLQLLACQLGVYHEGFLLVSVIF